MSNERKETIADIIEEKLSDAHYIRENNDTMIGRMNALKLEEEADRIEAAHRREVEELEREIAELREFLVRRSSHLNAILQKALELRNGVPPELRKVMDECIVAEDEAVGFGVFSIH